MNEIHDPPGRTPPHGLSRTGEARGAVPLDRRGFLRGLAGGGTALALAGWIPAQDGRYDAPSGLHALSPKEFAVLRAAGEAILGGVPVDAADVALEADRELALMGDPILTDMKTVLGLIEHLTFLGGHLHRFTALDPPTRLRYLRGWGLSRFNLRRAAYHAVRTLVHFYGWARPDTRPLTAYQGPWTDRFEFPAYPVDFGEVS